MKIYKASDEAANYFEKWCKQLHREKTTPTYLKLAALPVNPTPEQLDIVFNGVRSRWSSCYCEECGEHKDIVVEFNEIEEDSPCALCVECLQEAVTLIKQ